MVLPLCTPGVCGKDFRQRLHKPSPNYGHKKKKIRLVPAFTIQSMQKNTKVFPPPKCNVYLPVAQTSSMFMSCYQRGEIPVSIEFAKNGKRLCWKVPVEDLDFRYYLPIFFDGLTEAKYPFNFIVEQGINDMITKGTYKILPVVPQLIIPIKKAFETKRPSVLIHALTCLQMIVTGCDKVGEALVPYYRQILPVLNLFIHQSTSMKDPGIVIEGGNKLYETIEESLQILEKYGGPNAYINLKYMIPIYESCVRN